MTIDYYQSNWKSVRVNNTHVQYNDSHAKRVNTYFFLISSKRNRYNYNNIRSSAVEPSSAAESIILLFSTRVQNIIPPTTPVIIIRSRQIWRIDVRRKKKMPLASVSAWHFSAVCVASNHLHVNGAPTAVNTAINHLPIIGKSLRSFNIEMLRKRQPGINRTVLLRNHRVPRCFILAFSLFSIMHSIFSLKFWQRTSEWKRHGTT